MRVIGIGFFSLVFGNNTIEIGIELETKNVSFQPEKLELNWTNIIKSTFSPVQLELLLNWTSLAWNRSWIGIYFCQNCTSLTWTDGWMPLVVDCGLSFNIGIIFTYFRNWKHHTKPRCLTKMMISAHRVWKTLRSAWNHLNMNTCAIHVALTCATHVAHRDPLSGGGIYINTYRPRRYTEKPEKCALSKSGTIMCSIYHCSL